MVNHFAVETARDVKDDFMAVVVQHAPEKIKLKSCSYLCKFTLQICVLQRRVCVLLHKL